MPLSPSSLPTLRDGPIQPRAILRITAREDAVEPVQDGAEGVLAVGRADRVEAPELVAFDAAHRSVVREREVSTPQLANERMRVRERDGPRVRFRTWAIASSVLMG